jgi:hypothetical protein
VCGVCLCVGLISLYSNMALKKILQSLLYIIMEFYRLDLVYVSVSIGLSTILLAGAAVAGYKMLSSATVFLGYLEVPKVSFNHSC